jgi:hypothetical protein
MGMEVLASTPTFRKSKRVGANQAIQAKRVGANQAINRYFRSSRIVETTKVTRHKTTPIDPSQNEWEQIKQFADNFYCTFR